MVLHMGINKKQYVSPNMRIVVLKHRKYLLDSSPVESKSLRLTKGREEGDETDVGW